MTAPFDPIVVLTPVFVLAILAEMLLIRRRLAATRRGYSFKDSATNIAVAVGNLSAGALLVIVPMSLGALLAPVRILHIEFSVASVAVCFLLDDFFAYWGHRIGHRVRWAWADHVVHHSSQYYNLTTAIRQGWFAYLTPGTLTLVPLLIVGFPPAMLVFVHGLNQAYQFFLHTECVGRLHPWAEWLLNTPSHHRIHHAANKRYLDRNFGCVFIVWDRLFGTFAAEDPAEPPRYGLTRDIATFNALRVSTHEWRALLHDVLRSRSPGEVVAHLFRPPG